MRLDKFLAKSCIGTRKIVRSYIENGDVKVNNVVITIPAIEIDESKDIVKYLDKIVKCKENVYYMFHKPRGCVTARRDVVEKTVFDYFKDIDMEGIFHVCRLDKDTEGLLLFTNDGEFNNELMNPKKHMDKKYYFIALGSINEKEKEMLENGISIGKDEPLTKPAKIEIEKCGEYGELEKELNLQEYYNKNTCQYKQPIVCGYLTISEGRKHQVKRMLKAVGCYVIYLKRVEIGNLALDDDLKKGHYRSLTNDEVNYLLKKN